MNKFIGVIGIGSPVGYDNVAEHAITTVKKQLSIKLPAKIHCEYYDRPGISLLEYIKDFEIVHLIDAVVSDQPIGTIHRYEDIHILKENQLQFSTHGLGVAEILMLGETLNCLPPKIIIHGIEINEDKIVCKIPDKIIDASCKVATQVISEIQQSLKLQCQ